MTMVPIAKFTGAGVTRTFTNIPQTYKHLQIRMTIRDTFPGSTTSAFFRFNGDTTATYWLHGFRSTGAGTEIVQNTALASYLQIAGIPANNIASGSYATLTSDILEYRNTSKLKTVKTISGWDANGAGFWSLASGIWNSTAAITSIQVGADSLGDGPDTIITLYGITG
jgi:hypothetical protein